MAIQKSRLGRGLGNLIAGGISNAVKPPAPAAKPAPAKQPPVKAKAQATPTKSGKSVPAKSGKATAAAQTGKTAKTANAVKPAAKPVSSAKPAVKAASPAKPVTKPAAKPVAKKPASAAKPAATAATSAQPSASAAQQQAGTAHSAETSASQLSGTAAASTQQAATAFGGAATSAAATGGAASPYREIAVNTVVPNPYQPRRDMDAEHIAELANSIASEGLLQPVVVRPLDGGKGYELIAGERRWRAHQKLGLKTIAARIINASDSSSAVISLIENIQRQALNPIEEALGFASLMRDFDLTQEAVSERIGRPRASIANSLRLLALAREIQGYVAKGILSVGHAKILLGLEEPAQRLLIARRIIEGGISVRETENLVRRLKNEKTHRTASAAHAPAEADRTAIADLEKQLSSKLNTKVQLRHTPKKGRIVIEYYGNEDLQRILERTGLQL